MRREGHWSVAVALGAFAQLVLMPIAVAGPHDELVARHAAAHGVPEQLVHRVIRIESRGNASAVHAGNYGLMQIRLGTARGVGYAGDAQGLLDPDTNLTYGVKYLAGAYRAAGCNADRAVHYYQRGYYGTRPSACGAPTQIAATASDVIKPKVVRTETIGPAKPGPAPAPPVGNFEPVRIAPPPPAVASAASAEPAAKFELASVPMPPSRPDVDMAPKQNEKPNAKPAQRPARVQAVPAAVEAKPRADDSSPAVVTFLKKLVTPDPKARKRPADEAEAMPQVQAPQ